MPTIHLMTWNLKQREAALAMFVKHVASRSNKGELFVAALQECGEDAAAIVAKVEKEGGAKVHAMGNGTLSIVCSAPLDPMPPPLDKVGGRLVLTRTRLAGQRFAVVNYHGHAQRLDGSPNATERGGIASEARWRIDDHAQTDPVIVLGDFNADSQSSEIKSLYCFSFAPAPKPRSLFSHNRQRKQLCVAPMQFPTGCEGTYWRDSPTEGPSWHKLDFIVTEPRFSVQTRVLDSLNGEPLTDGTKPVASDHLPVAGTMDLV